MMLRSSFAALTALASATAVAAQAVAAARGFQHRATPAPDRGPISHVPGGSEARFVDTTGTARLVIDCTQGDAAGDDFAHQRGAGGEHVGVDQLRDAATCRRASSRTRCASPPSLPRLRPSARRDRVQPRADCSDDAGRCRALVVAGVARSSTNDRRLPNLNRNTSLALSANRNSCSRMASTQRKEVIRCLMVQQRGRYRSFAR